MANYKDIKGFHVQSLSTDPARTQSLAGSWASGPSLNTGRNQAMGLGIQTAAFAVGGDSPAGAPVRDEVESYNGTAWTNGTDINTGRRSGQGFGTTTAGVVASGYAFGTNPNPQFTETWNGSAWSESGDLTRAGGFQSQGVSAASSTSAVIYGGQPGTTYFKYSETWNGSSWSEGSDLNTGRVGPFGAGTTTAGICIAGGPLPITATETYNGTSWTTIPATVNTARNESGACNGTQTDCMIAGGYDGSSPGSVGNTEIFDGTSFSEAGDLGTARYNLCRTYAPSMGTANSLGVLGGPPSSQTITEEWTAPSTFTKMNEGQVYYNSSSTNAYKVTQTSIPTGTWASSNNMNSKRRNCAAFGTQTASVAAGSGPPDTSNTEEYDGSSWTEVTNMPTALGSNMGAGVLTSGLSFGGALNTPTASTDKAETYEYDGTNWTDGADLNQARHAGAGMGASQSAAMCAGGHSPNYSNTEIYNGTSWTEVNELNQGRQLLCGVGTTTAALAIGGDPKPLPTQSESWDGTSWTGQGALAVNVYANAGFGTSTLAIACGGLPPGTDTNANMRSAQYWNGSSWTEVSEMATSRASAQGTGTGPAGLAFGGYNPANAPDYDADANKTEEWGGLTLVNKTITLA